MRSVKRDIGHPSLVTFIVLELALKLIGRNQCRLTHLVTRTLVPTHRLDSCCAHEPRSTVFSASHTRLTQVTEDTWTRVDAYALVVELFDLKCQSLVDLCPLS
jgi:hypothetical protein